MTTETRSTTKCRGPPTAVAGPLALVVALLLSAGCTRTVGVPDVRPERAPVEHWAEVLRKHVNDQGEIDFRGLALEPRDLHAFVNHVSRVSPATTPQAFPDRASVLAYHLNAYNALAMYNVLDSGIPESLSGYRKISFFVFRRLLVGGEARSLYDYENEVIRPLGEERVHFALNCMVTGCPRLPRTPFSARGLDRQLDAQARRFFAEARNLRIDDAARAVWLSQILDFYPEDFLAKAPSLNAYANRYAAAPVPEDYRTRFIDYDWTVNRQGRH